MRPERAWVRVLGPRFTGKWQAPEKPKTLSSFRRSSKRTKQTSKRSFNTRLMNRSPEQEDDPSKSLDAPKHRDGMRSASETHHKQLGHEQKSENIDSVVYNGLKFPVEHACDGYPKELIRTRELGDSCMFVCCKCFKYTMDPIELKLHEMMSDHIEKPVGTLVHSFEDGKYEIYEVDGANPEYQPFIQRMCLFGKFFIQNKSIWYEFDNFLFYILVENGSNRTKLQWKLSTGNDQSETPFSYCGFYSKEKVCYDDNNLACIILYPPYRSRGLGAALIDFSYHVSKAMGKTGGPEKPISELGKRGYLSYWARTVSNAIISIIELRRASNLPSRSTRSTNSRTQSKLSNITKKSNNDSPSIDVSGMRGNGTVTVDDISKITGMALDDIVETLNYMNIIHHDGKQPNISRRRLEDWSEGRKK